MAKRRPEVEVDADTGEEIIYFIRRGRPYLYLRDRVTKLFIRRLRYVRLSITISVEYEVKGKPYRNIYIDARISADLRPRDFPNRHRIEKELEDKLLEIIEFKFNPELAGMAKIEGIEYGSKRCGFIYPKYIAHIIWERATGARKEEYEVGTL
ncbi:MAG: hypothetical protein DRN49_04220 [Thaumarchaeota archaeon]|nr:MAG: hypothetical protein DRN49_04220 [Nitrososphaerota archaeon]